MLTAVTEFTAMPFDQLCLNCQGTASLRCGPFGSYCLECFNKLHKTVNIFHVAEKFEVRTCKVSEWCAIIDVRGARGGGESQLGFPPRGSTHRPFP